MSFIASKPLNIIERSAIMAFVITGLMIPLSTGAMNVFYVAAVVLVLLSRYRLHLTKIFTNPITLIMLIFFLALTIGVFYSSDTLLNASKKLAKYQALLLAVFYLPICQNKRYANYAILMMMLGLIITLILSYLKVFGHVTLIHDARYSDAAVFKDHIQTGFLMAFAAYLFALYALQNQGKLRYFYWLLTLLASYNTLLMSTGRTGYIIFFCLLILFTWQFGSWRGLVIGIILACIMAGSAFLLSRNFRDHISIIWTNYQQYQQQKHKDTSEALRLQYLKNSIQLIKQHPIIGTGTGSYHIEYAKINHSELVTNPHNEYLNIGVQIGLLGVLLMLALFYLPWHFSFALESPYKQLSQAVVIIMAIGCLGNSWLMDHTENHFFAYFMVICFANLKFTLSHKWERGIIYSNFSHKRGK